MVKKLFIQQVSNNAYCVPGAVLGSRDTKMISALKELKSVGETDK